MLMKKITYKERAKFYDFECQKEKYVLDFLKDFKSTYNISQALCCPCGTGIYLEDFSMLFRKSIFADLEPEMILYLEQKIKLKKIKNIIGKICDINNINEIGTTVDAIFIFNQGIQFLDLDCFNSFLNLAQEITNYLVLDLFDFLNIGHLSYYNSSIEDNVFYFSKEFNIKSYNIKRYNSHIHEKNSILLKYKYTHNNNPIYESILQLYNYNYQIIKDIIHKNKYFKIIDVYMRKNGNYILTLKRNG